MSDLAPRKARRTISQDDGARCVVALLAEFAGRVSKAVGKEPDISPPEGGMSRLGNRERASYVWFIPCHAEYRLVDGSKPASCNHGIGVDRTYGQYEVRAWAHGAPGVHDVSLHTHVVTAALLETAAGLIGLPFAEVPDCGALSCKCPVCLRDGIPHDGAYLETHKTLEGHPCHGSGWNITNRSRG